jgi:hypothetical protein
MKATSGHVSPGSARPLDCHLDGRSLSTSACAKRGRAINTHGSDLTSRALCKPPGKLPAGSDHCQQQLRTPPRSKPIARTSSPPSQDQLEALIEVAGKAILDCQRASSSTSANFAPGSDPRLGERHLLHLALALTELATAVEQVSWPDALPLASAATEIYQHLTRTDLTAAPDLAGALSRLLMFLTAMGSCVPRRRLVCAGMTSGPGS